LVLGVYTFSILRRTVIFCAVSVYSAVYAPCKCYGGNECPRGRMS